VERIRHQSKTVKIGLVGKYVQLHDAYLSVAEALRHAGYALDARIDITWIEESEQPEIAEARDYYSVPTIFWKGEKLYEAHFTHSYDVIKQNIREAFDKVLAG